MRADNNQLDLYRDSPQLLAAKWREAAETSKKQFPEDHRRYEYYLREARKLEAGHHHTNAPVLPAKDSA